MQTQFVPTLKRETNPFLKEKRLSSLPIRTRLGKNHFDRMGKKEFLLGNPFHFSKGNLFLLIPSGNPQGKRQVGNSLRGTENPSLVALGATAREKGS